MLAKDIMQKEVVTLSALMTLREAAAVLAEKGISGAPVVDSLGGLHGVVSQTDIIRRSASNAATDIGEFYRDVEALSDCGKAPAELDALRVVEVMTPRVISADESATVEELAALMLRRGIHRVIITREGRLSGIVTTMDILKAFSASASRRS